MIVVDAHCHAGVEKYEPLEVLLYQMHRSGVEKATVVQHFGQYDNRYLLEGARRFPGRFAIIGLVDPDQLDASGVLERWAKEGLQGVRYKASWRSPGKDPLAIWKKALDLELVVSCRATAEELGAPEFQMLVKSLPTLRIIIEHLGDPGRDEKPPYTRFKNVLKLAELPNTYMKIPGYGEICIPPFPFKNIPPLTEMALEAFGSRRLMWGSDWPPVAMREGYRNALQFTLQNFPAVEKDKEWIFGKTALSLFKFDKA